VINPVQLTHEEQFILLDHKKKSRCDLIALKSHAILLTHKKYSPFQIADILFRSEKTIKGWIKQFQLQRIASIFPHTLNNQNAAKLTREQKDEISWVLRQKPSEYGIPKEFWDISTLKTYIKGEFGIEYESDESYRLVLTFSDFSYHLPATFDIHRDDVFVEQRIKEIRKEVIPYMKDLNWLVFAADESRIVWEAVVRRLWLPKGEKSVIKVERKRKAQSFLGLLNLKTGEDILYKLDWQNDLLITGALEKLVKQFPGKRICIIWDNARFHKGKLLREKLSTTLKDIHLINLPPYAPDTNPQEHVWKYGKDSIANIQKNSLKEVVEAFVSNITGRTYSYYL
jgi:transposase